MRRGHGFTCFAAGALVFAAAVSLLPSTARAQVNTENLRKRIKTTGYTFLVEGSLTADTGNTQGISAGGGIGGGWASEPHLIFGYARVDYSRFNGSTSVNKSFAHARYNYEFTSWLWGEAFAQAQSDAFQRLAFRSLWGLGPRFRALHVLTPEELDVYLGSSYMLEQDIITGEPGTPYASTQTTQIWHRWSQYVTVQWQLDSRVILATTLYVQPAFDDFTDVRVLCDTLMTFKVTNRLSASIAASVRYDSQPPAGVQTTDTEVKNTLAVTF
ncbi:MAG TPA: DUF481 domain-containing protein [Polyangiaceae bacterium]